MIRSIIKYTLVIILVHYSITSINAQEEARLLRFPTIYKNTIVLSYAGDLYQANTDEGTARKLTNHIGYEMFAKFSPNGEYIAFTGQYDGNTEVYVIPAQGGIPKRLTYTATLRRDDIADRMGPNNIVMAWTPDSKYIIYRSRKKSFNSFKGQLFKVSIEGGLSTELPLSDGGFCSFSSDGSKLAFNRVFREFRTWKYYKGGMADDIRIYNFDDNTVSKITSNEAQDIIPMWINHEIYFLSDRDRTMNLFVYDTKTNETKKVTSFTDFDIKFPSVNGNNIIFEKGGYIYKFDAQKKITSKINIFIANDQVYARNEIKDAAKQIHSSALSHDGNRVVFCARGDIFTVPFEKGITRNLTRTTGVHEKDAKWSPDGKYLAYISDLSGEFEIYIKELNTSSEAIQLTKNADTYMYEIEWSLDSKKIMWSDKKMRLRYIDISSKIVTEVTTGEYGEIDSYNWSPDSKWIVFSKTSDNRFDRVYLYSLNSKKSTAITENWYESYNANFSADGKYLLFISERDLNPMYSEIEWNHTFHDMQRIYILTLSKDTKSPFALSNDEVKLGVEDDKNEDTGNKNEEKTDNETKIDLEGLINRITVLPVSSGNYSNIHCIDNKVYYSQYIRGNDVSSKMFDLKSEKENDLGKIRFSISSNHKKMLVRSGAKYSVIDLPSSIINIGKSIDLSGMKVKVDYREEWQQIFDEAWRQMRDFFYVENMHGVDWQAMYEKYNILVPYVNHRDDLTYIIGEMIGELNVGHAYILSGEKPKAERINLGLLGAKLTRHSSGYYQIDKILKGENWNKKLRSPLTEIGMEAKAGEFIIEVNGLPTNEMKDINEALIGYDDKIVELSINLKPDKVGIRKILVKPIADEANLYYFNWVQENIKKVEEATDGQVGYLHIPDMQRNGLIEFAKYYYPQLNKKGIIIDGRGNGGGNVSPMIIERLQREITRANMRRNSNKSSYTHGQAFGGPKLLLIDKYSASDGDLFPYAFKKHKIGTVVGERSWGGVVGIRGSLNFVDGTDLRKPEFASYSAEKSEWIIEGYGVEPDIYVENDPVKEYYGTDQQLNKAIEIVLEQLKDYKEIPPIPEAPDKSK